MAVFLYFYQEQTRVTFNVVVTSLSGILAINILLYAMIRTGFNKRFKDPSLTLLQMVIATFWAMVVVYYAASFRSVVLLIYLVVFVFGLFKLKVWEYLFLSVFAVVNYAAVILLLYKTHPESINTTIDVLNIVVLALVLPWFSLVGGYITNLRSRISKALSTIERLTNNIQDVIFVTDMNLKYTYISPSVKSLRGYEPEEVMKQEFSDAFAFSSVDAAMKAIAEIMALEKSGDKGSISRTLQLELKRKDGTAVWTETKFSFVRDKKMQTVGILGVSRDITERKRAEEQYRLLADHMTDQVWLFDMNLRFKYFSPSAERASGYSFAEIKDISLDTLLTAESFQRAMEMFSTEMAKAEITPPPPDYQRSLEVEFRCKDGHLIWLDTTVSFIQDENGKPISILGESRDVTGRKLAEERIQYLATHDTLTGLPNRMLFGQLLNQAIKSAQRRQRQFAVLFIDLDRFKIINDTMGHDVGDELLKEIAMRFRQTLRAVDVVGRPKDKDDVVGRLGGDEFIILIEEVTDLSHVATVAQKILGTVMKPMILSGEECRVTSSIGISVYPRDGEDEQTLMKKADMAMYFAKEEGKNNFQFYSQNILSQSFERFSIETNLRRALERNELYLEYQAKMDFKTGAITGVEALLRWDSPQLGSITPTQFIPVAEETGMIVPIGRWVLKTACAQNVAWQRKGLPPVHVAVNLSLRQLMDDKIIEYIKNALDESGMAPELLELEITESMIMFKPVRLIELLVKIKSMGVRLALDDFGTGYSSLAQIKHLPIDTLKVDRSFIRNLPHDAEDRAIIEAIITMGKTLSLNVVAEGVETPEQENFLREKICDEMQGFYFSKPIAPDKFADLLRKNKASSSM
jgi:diguanylate cyclase (GGDEF)-like protein/PAS domain S-box-containing protein